MGGRANAGNTKMFSNIDAARNAPLRATRVKEIETDRATKAAAQAASVAKPKTDRSAKKIIDKKSTVSALMRTDKTDSKGHSVFERQNIESLARSKDGTLHITKGGKYSFHVTDAVSGSAVATLGSKKSAMKFLNAATRPDGKASPTLQRYIEFSHTRKADLQALPKEKQQKLSRAFGAVMKLKARIGYD